MGIALGGGSVLLVVCLLNLAGTLLVGQGINGASVGTVLGLVGTARVRSSLWHCVAQHPTW